MTAAQTAPVVGGGNDNNNGRGDADIVSTAELKPSVHRASLSNETCACLILNTDCVVRELVDHTHEVILEVDLWLRVL